MANSSFLSRFSLSRDDSPVLPLHTKSLRHKPSEYDLEQLSPRPSQSVLFSASDPEPPDFFPKSPPAKSGPSSVAFAYRDAYRDQPSSSRASSRRPRDYDYAEDRTASQATQPPLFAGPPPPIATSVLMFRDVEGSSGSTLEYGRRHSGANSRNNLAAETATAASSIRLPTSTVLLEPRQTAAGNRMRRRDGTQFDGDSTWTILQRRERALQKEIQHFLDVQSSGLSAGLGRGPLNPSPSPDPSSGGGGRSRGSRSNTRSNTPTAESIAGRSLRLPTERAAPTGAVIPVRQPKPRKLGLRAARAGLARSISLLADLKAEEDESLTMALQARKRALAHLRRLASRRSDIARELQFLETDDAEPLTRELATLRSAHASTTQQITELEDQLTMLRQRKRTLEGRIEDAVNQRESGLSGYRGALKDVDAQLTAVLRRPPIQPLDIDALGAHAGNSERPQEGGIRLEERDNVLGDGDTNEDIDASAGLEFLRLLPERRTAEMARFWWENEVRLLGRRKAEVESERAALDEGGAVWQDAVRLVSDFEANLRREMASDIDEDDVGANKGKTRTPTPEERMRTQLQTMATVIKGLRGHVEKAEHKGWNLLICAIGAELEAFQEARNLLRQSLRDAGLDIEDDEDDGDHRTSTDNSQLIATLGPSTTKSATPPGFVLDGLEDSSATPRLARSVSDGSAVAARGGDDRDGYHTASESDDNDVPPGLLITEEHGQDHDEESSSANGSQSRHNDKDDSSENEIPPEFLSEQHPDDDNEP
ncbi:uncharacterized protein SPSK_03110 [Sporothrix schenckii 1099-18]|uniref:Autophagy-related protein 28 n=1 Tax=Sporothrix schenckii 1099-18 TaxID=1397361 RepID=A0A0F2LY56_SPOSC|nr:uncharacterized protein SPSK_03110 [Sporothrix schenckii 1099-18]KJR82402.1 hypothetical protein SPSK_03110 [Sporothrix schenckii 1099-18]